MESGLEDRNNWPLGIRLLRGLLRLNGVRPRRPEQWVAAAVGFPRVLDVSMESGLEDRNNLHFQEVVAEQLNEVSMESGLEDRNNFPGMINSTSVAPSQWSPA